ncbi:immunoglobulin alpha-2 heavy chain-like [Protopterus annectens]|uniref:immunoglobulin alpha-2 heavy chain-like n=1 Tax=Protopterus annectens TaxID=7888 RepID=UPI001CFAFAD1|nr:immunoglobulin alpha-2 heavy chain-like [Protopterus annectens]
MGFTAFWIFTYILLATVSTLDVIQYPDEQTQSAGSTAQLNCSVENVHNKINVVYWYRQGEDGSWNFLYQVYKGGNTEGRYSGGVNEQETAFYLQIENTKRNDSAVYYCAVKQDNIFLFGNGSTLIITDDVAGSPSLLILTPTQQETNSDDTITLLCLVTDTSSQWSPIQWNISGETMESLEDAGVFDKAGSFSIGSQVSIPLQTWNSPATFFCQVRSIHNGGPEEKILSDTGLVQKHHCMMELYFRLPGLVVYLIIITACTVLSEK